MRVSFAPHDRTRHVYRVLAEWDEQAHGMTREECEKQLLDGEPRIAVLTHKRAIMFVLLMHEPGDEKIAARRMRELFTSSKKA